MTNQTYSPEYLAKKIVIQRRLLKEIRDYFEQKRQPINLSILAGKFNKKLESLGGFNETMDNLEFEESIYIVRTKTGRTVVFPGEFTLEDSIDNKGA